MTPLLCSIMTGRTADAMLSHAQAAVQAVHCVFRCMMVLPQGLQPPKHLLVPVECGMLNVVGLC